MTAIEGNHSILETHTLGVFTIQVWDNGIFHTQVQGNTVVELKDVKEHQEFFKQRYDQKNKFLILVESGHDSTVTKEAREFSSSLEINARIVATAVVVKSLAERLMTNFIIRFTSQQKTKMQVFECREKAVKWLLSLEENATEANSGSNLAVCL